MSPGRSVGAEPTLKDTMLPTAVKNWQRTSRSSSYWETSLAFSVRFAKQVLRSSITRTVRAQPHPPASGR